MRFNSVLVPVVAFAFSGFALAAGSQFKVDTTKSVITWTGSKPVGSHTGTLMIKDGTLDVEGSTIKGGQFVLDMSTITDKDLPDAEYRAKLEGHLKSKDFFDVASHPTGSFTITKVSKGKVANEATISGNLELRGIKKEISFPAVVTMTGTTATATADVKINRMDWKISYNSEEYFKQQSVVEKLEKNFKDKIISNTIEVKLELYANAVGGKTAETTGHGAEKKHK